jgi:hypothetical protein
MAAWQRLSLTAARPQRPLDTCKVDRCRSGIFMEWYGAVRDLDLIERSLARRVGRVIAFACKVRGAKPGTLSVILAREGMPCRRRSRVLRVLEGARTRPGRPDDNYRTRSSTIHKTWNSVRERRPEAEIPLTAKLSRLHATSDRRSKLKAQLDWQIRPAANPCEMQHWLLRLARHLALLEPADGSQHLNRIIVHCCPPSHGRRLFFRTVSHG